MSIYFPIRDFLQKERRSKVTLRFHEIEEILGFPLPASARKYPAWWANQTPFSSQCSSWMQEGWESVELDLASQRVSFEKSGFPNQPTGQETHKAKIQRLPRDKVDAHEKDAQFEHTENAERAEYAEIQFKWLPIGQFEIAESDTLVHTAKLDGPAVYRVRIVNYLQDEVYIGETVNLSRRLRQYCAPGDSQQTNLRLNGLLRQRLQSGASAQIEIATQGAVLVTAQCKRQIDFSNKFERRLLENVAVVLDLQTGFSLLNN